MSNEEILQKVIKKAIANGWTVNDWTDDDDFQWEVESGDFEGDYPCMKYGGMGETFYLDIGSLMLDHYFAKALWGEDTSMPPGPIKTAIVNGVGVYYMQPWQRHLQQMVIADDPIKYLGGHL